MYPLSTAVNQDHDIQLIGYNLHEAKVHVKPTKAGEMDLPDDMAKYRMPRRNLKFLVTNGPELVEVEPNDTPSQATQIPVPGTISGRIWSANGNDTESIPFQSRSRAVTHHRDGCKPSRFADRYENRSLIWRRQTGGARPTPSRPRFGHHI